MDEFPWGPGGREFPSTSWTLVASARDPGEPEAREALAELCRLYWYPLYVYVRRRGNTAEDARDLTQEFFARLLEKDGLSGVSRDKGRFRAFLLVCCRHFLANQYERAGAAKRGGGRTIVSMDFEDAEHRYRREPADPLSPEILYERRWALTLVDQVRERLETEYRVAGRVALFAPLLAGLMGESTAPAYAEVARNLDMTEAAVKKAAQRLRERFGVLLRAQVAATVAAPEEVDDEVRDLMALLGD